jgi:hypothetical protein
MIPLLAKSILLDSPFNAGNLELHCCVSSLSSYSCVEMCLQMLQQNVLISLPLKFAKFVQPVRAREILPTSLPDTLSFSSHKKYKVSYVGKVIKVGDIWIYFKITWSILMVTIVMRWGLLLIMRVVSY